MKIKRLCDLGKKEIKKHWAEIEELLIHPTHACQSCCRVANNKKWLCKPEKLGKPEGGG